MPLPATVYAGRPRYEHYCLRSAPARDLCLVFYPQRHTARQIPKTRLDFLREQKEVLYENLRDLNFEYSAGKYTAEDYAAQRAALENETAAVLAEIDQLELKVALHS